VGFRVQPPVNGGNGAFYFVSIGTKGAVGAFQTGTLGIRPGVWGGTTTTLELPKIVPLEKGEWFELEVIAKANRICVLVKGQIVIDYTDHKRTFTRGRLRLMKRDPTLVVRFRNLEIEDLSLAPNGD
jgi:Domain of Unknown Function (DUF1080)